MPIKQWVNLARMDAFVEDGISDEKRLDWVDVTVKMKKGDPALVKLRAVPEGGDNIDYNEAEQRRNVHFCLVPMSPELTTGTETPLKQRFYLPAAGGNKYKIEAKYKGEVKASSKVIETIRRLYYQIVTMKTIAAPGNFSSVEAEFEKGHVELKEREAGAGKDKIALFPTVSNLGSKSWLKDEVKKAYSAKKFWPNCVAAVFVDQSATCAENEAVERVRVVSRARSFFTGARTEHVMELKDAFGGNAYLWKDLDPNCDKADKWWLKGATFTREGGQPVDISRADVTLEPPAGHGGHAYHKVRIALDSKKFGNLVGGTEGTIELKTYVVKGFQGGYSTGDSNMIVVVKRAWWDIFPSDGDRSQTLVHEMGHKIGLAATGDKTKAAPPDFDFIDNKTPDSHGNLYGEYYSGPNENNKGHQGNHCQNGMTSYDATKNEWRGTPGCVMFGGSPTKDAATGTWHNTPLTFCGDCGESLRKLDLNGFHIEALKKGIG